MKTQGYKDRRDEHMGMEGYEKDREDNDYGKHSNHVFMDQRRRGHSHGTHHIKLTHENCAYED